ncbi:MAG: hypothetical protein FE834_04860 [Gammaproteobacteria bacterium]|nr:hypothetical protein [Gammaproteobacteria bacterium]
MQEILPQLSILVVLTGVSVAVVQYLFTNHQTHLKDFIASLKDVEFNRSNEYDLSLENQWDDAINNCKKHTYFLNPNRSIAIGFAIIVILIFVYVLTAISVFTDVISVNFLNLFILIIALALLSWAIVNAFVLRQVFKKEDLIRIEFDEIETQHQLVNKILK